MDEIKCQECDSKMRPVKVIHKNNSDMMEYVCINCNSRRKTFFEVRNEKTIR